MTRYFARLALFVVAASACSDGTSPVDLPVDRPFDFSLPSLRQLSPAYEGSNDTPISASGSSGATASSYTLDNLPPEWQAVIGGGILITQYPTIGIGFYDDVNEAFAHGEAKSIGNSYRSTLNFRVGIDGQQIGQNTSYKAETNLIRLPFEWGDDTFTKVRTHGQCGHYGDADLSHEANLFIGLPSKMFAILSQSGNATAMESQRACPVHNGGGGADESEWYICYWEDLYDYRGVFMRRIELGCEPFERMT